MVPVNSLGWDLSEGFRRDVCRIDCGWLSHKCTRAFKSKHSVNDLHKAAVVPTKADDQLILLGQAGRHIESVLLLILNAFVCRG